MMVREGTLLHEQSSRWLAFLMISSCDCSLRRKCQPTSCWQEFNVHQLQRWLRCPAHSFKQAQGLLRFSSIVWLSIDNQTATRHFHRKNCQCQTQTAPSQTELWPTRKWWMKANKQGMLSITVKVVTLNNESMNWKEKSSICRRSSNVSSVSGEWLNRHTKSSEIHNYE